MIEKPTFKHICLMYMQQLTNFPYIEKDFDAVTDYQLLCKVVDYLNQVIENNNEQNTAITNLYNAFIELKDFVDNYFDNLDVQDEINNKLDEMAESGQLTDIIAQYLGLAGMITFNTLADMKLAENLVNGSKCQTLGYHNVNDGGGAIYKIRQVTNDDVIDDRLIIEVYDNLLVGELIFDDTLNVEQMGAYGDNTHDDTLAIQSAINTQKDIYFNDKTYLVSDSLSIQSYSHLIFSKKGKIHFTGNNSCIYGLSCYYAKLENVNIESSNRTGIGILLEKARNCEIISPHLVDFSTGIKIDGKDEWSASNNIYNPYIYKFNIGIHLTANSGKQTNDTKVIGGYIIDQIREITTQYEESVCVKNDASCDTNVFIGVACEDADIGFLNQSPVSSTPMSLICCRSENMTSYHLRNSVACRNIYTYGCSFNKDNEKVSVNAMWDQNIDAKNIAGAYMGGANIDAEYIQYYDSGHNKRTLLGIVSEGIRIGSGNGTKQRVLIRGTNSSQVPSTYITAGGSDGLVFNQSGFVMKSSESSKYFKITVNDSGVLTATEYSRQD